MRGTEDDGSGPPPPAGGAPPGLRSTSVEGGPHRETSDSSRLWSPSAVEAWGRDRARSPQISGSEESDTGSDAGSIEDGGLNGVGRDSLSSRRGRNGESDAISSGIRLEDHEVHPHGHNPQQWQQQQQQQEQQPAWNVHGLRLPPVGSSPAVARAAAEEGRLRGTAGGRDRPETSAPALVTTGGVSAPHQAGAVAEGEGEEDGKQPGTGSRRLPGNVQGTPEGTERGSEAEEPSEASEDSSCRNSSEHYDDVDCIISGEERQLSLRKDYGQQQQQQSHKYSRREPPQARQGGQHVNISPDRPPSLKLSQTCSTELKSSGGGKLGKNTAGHAKTISTGSAGRQGENAGPSLGLSLRHTGNKFNMGPALPSRVKLKVTEEIMMAIQERLHSRITRPGSPMAAMLKPSASFTSFDRRASNGRASNRRASIKPRAASLQEEVDVFIELTCGDITKKDVSLVQRGPPKPWFILYPNLPARIRWDLFIVVVLTYSAFTIPYRLGFSIGADDSVGNVLVNTVVSLVYIADVVLNFFTAHYVDNMLVTSWSKIACRYLRTWFAMDFISSVPLDIVPGVSADANWPNVIRLCKVVRFMRYAAFLEAKATAMYISATLVRLGVLVISIIWFWHVIACGYWYLSVQSGLGVSEWALANAENNEEYRWLNYLRCVEWAIQTTFSYSPTADPETETQAYFTIFAVIGGVVMTSVIIGSASSALQSLDAEKEVRRQRMDKVMNYLKARKIPSYFQKIVLDYYGYMSDKHSQDSIIQELPVTIQARMSLLLNRDLLKYMPALRVLDLNSVISLMQSLYSRVFLPAEYVFKAGDAGLYLYFLKTGACEIVLPDGKNVACYLTMGEIAGQLALFNKTNHDFSLRAFAFSEVLHLDAEVYEEIAEDSERFSEYVETEAIKQEQLVRAATANLTRFSKLNRINTEQEKLGAAGKKASLVKIGSRKVFADGKK